MLRARFSKCSDNVKNILFGYFCSSIYGINLWCRNPASSINRLRVAYGNAYRILFNLPRRIHMNETMVNNRRGVLEDVLGHEDVLEDTFWSPWPWPRRSSPWPWPQVLENCPVLGSRTAIFFELLKFCRSPEKKFWKTFFTEERLKNLFEDPFFLGGDTCACVLGLGLGFFCVLCLGLEPCVLDSTSGITTRGGVEDTRLEAKAKDTKTIRGQGQPFRGQTLSRPRTGMLEAKAKDTSASALQKKKRSSQKFFRRSQKKKGLHKNFSSDLHKKTFSKKFFKRSTEF